MRSLDKNYDHQKYEEEIYQKWENSGAFSPSDAKKTFSIIMPPPNANDPLHVGHAMFVTIEDILTRYHRMKGEAVLWLPGTDHAGIETQFVYEKKLAKQDKSRFDFDRDTLYKLIWEYVQENSGVAVNQMKRLGASADWNRFTFTLDPDVVEYVKATFRKLHDDGLVYRGERLVNYCTKCGTSYSELEVEHEDRVDPMIYMKYGPFTIATVRPETKFRDTALAVNPKDKRYKKYIGQTLEIMGLLGSVKMTVIPDPEVDPKFGTGIMKVTPAHDPHDFELGEKFHLPVTPIIGLDGRMDFSWYKGDYQERANKYHGKKVAEMRKIMLEDLREDGLLVKIDDKYTHRVGLCYRCKSVLEPIPLPQFFIKTRSLADKALAALDSKETRVLGVGREKILRHWLNNIRDWNISRQIVWGIRIPVWYDVEKNPNMIITTLVEGKKITGTMVEQVRGGLSFFEIEKGLQKVLADRDAEYVVSPTRPGPTYIQETDTFDTWFSSGQWPVVTLKTTKPEDFERFYPTTVMETGYDILPIWVMRMMLMGIYDTDKAPFEYVYLHGLVRDELGRKMSKSVGNVVNPLDMVDTFGADALRMALVMSTTPGNDSNVGETKIRGMRNLANKIWNAARYAVATSLKSQASNPNEEFKSQLNATVKQVTELLDKLKIGQAAEVVYDKFWHWYCDEVIELHKKGELSDEDMRYGLEVFLKLLHPFVPFVTEVAWQELGRHRQDRQTAKSENRKMLIESMYPKVV